MIWTMLPWLIATLSAGFATACNPLTTNGCPSIPGLSTPSYSIDFTKEKSLPKDWILADGSDVSFGSNGIEFNFRKRKDAPYIWTNFYVSYGRIDVEMQVAQGTGVITSAVMFSDDNDEIDWEFSGSNFGAGPDHGKVQTNVFGKGITGNYDRGMQYELSPPPQSAFHIYTINWTPEKIEWILDGVTKYTENNNGLKIGNYQFPQTPSRLHLGVWDAGDPDTAEGTRQWAGGLTDYSKCPYVAYVRTVKISTPYPCKTWKYPDNFSGSWADVQCTNETLPSSTLASPSLSSAKPKSTEATYTVVAGDNGYSIADKLGCTFDQLVAVNPNVKWDYLDIGQKLNNPGFDKQATSLSTSGPTNSGLSSSNSNVSVATSTALATDATGTPPVTNTTGNPSVINTTSTAPITNAVSIIPVTNTTNTTPVTTAPPVCSSDDCYNSMVAAQFITPALSFCSSYNKTNALGIPSTPAYLSGCNGNVTRVKSACDCLTSTESTTTNASASSSIVPSTSSTLANSALTATATTTTTTTSSAKKTTSKTKKTTSAKTTTSSHKAWNIWSGSNGGKGWGSWKRNERSTHHTNNHRFDRILGGHHHA